MLDPDLCPHCGASIGALGPHRCLEHGGAHIKHDVGVNIQLFPCGFCLRPLPICVFYLKKGRGSKGVDQIDYGRSRCSNLPERFSYGTAATSQPSSPCSNIPIRCPLCAADECAVWRYCMEEHFRVSHPLALASRYAELWTLSKAEDDAMLAIWKARHATTSKVKAKPRTEPLLISEAHDSRLAFNNEYVLCVHSQLRCLQLLQLQNSLLVF